MHVALARTVIFWPSEAVRVPIVDTPGTSDANSLNADVTQQAINEAMAKTSSQLLLCGEKSFETEASLADYAMQYFKHMLTSKTGRPAIKGILMPASQFFFGPSQLRSPELQAQDDERVARSMSQLRRWAEMANQDLAKHRRVSDAQLDVLLQRCEVRVVYMQLYASLCLQPAADLEELAFKAGFKANQLLMRTNGPWLMGEFTHPQCY